ncbi:CHRD domain-containing protein [Pelagibius sp. Alg239-R121]|uniref:CHRD domain-containing protein n=1 Tax=Pelagibius sp. Alg239-R121 TaxID=2993448 RepID=UPI0024A780A6|nr:CHRD domain-containing protein [Pelagibius sp. Alg239-R121]
MLSRFTKAAVLAVAVAASGIGTASAGIVTASAVIDADQEVPGNASTATGTALFSFDRDSGNYTFQLSVSGVILTDITFPDGNGLAFDAAGPAHLHNAPVGVNGPIVRTFNNQILYSETGDGFSLSAFGPLANVLTGITAEAFLNQLALGNIYVNIHSFPDFTGGEVRGQLFVIPEPASLRLLGIGIFVLYSSGLLRRLSNQATFVRLMHLRWLGSYWSVTVGGARSILRLIAIEKWR